MDRVEKALNLLGLAKRAGKLVLGTDAVDLALRGSGIAAVVLAEDLSAVSGSRFERLAREKGILVLRFATKEAFGRAFARRDLGVIGLLDAGLAAAIQKALS